MAKMEKQYRERLERPIDILVRSWAGILGTYPALNWTEGGMFIATDAAELKVNEVLWIGPADRGNASTAWSSLAVVVHRRPEGMGALLRRLHPAIRGSTGTVAGQWCAVSLVPMTSW
jgi:hypothetical protein